MKKINFKRSILFGILFCMVFGLFLPVIDGSLTLVDSDDFGEDGQKVWSDGTYIYLASRSSTGIVAYSFDNSTGFTKLANDYLHDSYDYNSVYGDGTYIYAVTNANGIIAYTFDGSTFTRITNKDDGDTYYDVWCNDSYIFTVCLEQGLRAYTFDGSTFTLVASQDDGIYMGVWCDGSYIYTASYDGGIRAYSFNGTAFTLLDSHDISDNYVKIWGDGTYIYVVRQGAGISAYTFDGSTLTHVAEKKDGGESYNDVHGDGTYIYCACKGDGLRVYTFDGSNFILQQTIDDDGLYCGVHYNSGTVFTAITTVANNIRAYGSPPPPNQTPDKPICVSPTDNQFNIPVDTTLKVHIVDVDGDSMSVDFYYSNDTLIQHFDNQLNDTDVETTALSLDYGTEYNWYAVANDSELENQSDTFNFTTIENTPPRFKTEWKEVAGQPDDVEMIHSLAVYNGNLYGGSNRYGRLYKWNDVDSWIEVAGKLGDETWIYSLAVYDGSLYGGTGLNGKLYKWNDVDSWIEVAGKLGEEININSLVVYNNNLYGGTSSTGKLYRWNDVDSWIEVADSLNFQDFIYSLAVYNASLFGGTGYDGRLFKWNDVDSWIEVAGKLGDEKRIRSLAVYDNNLYGGTSPNGKLYKWNDVDSWIEVAGKLGDETWIYSLAVYDGSLYGGTSEHAKLYKWNDVNSWVEVADTLNNEDIICSLAVYNDSLFGGTAYHSRLFKLSQYSMPMDNWINIPIDTTLTTNVSDVDNDTMIVSFYWSDDTLIETITGVTNEIVPQTSSLSLEYNTTYSWYATVNDSYSEITSDVFTFTTMPMPNFPPVKPSCISPLNNSIDISPTTTLKVHVADINNDSMNVSFCFIDGVPSFISYTSDDIYDIWANYPFAIRLSPTELSGHNNEYLTGVMVHDGNYCSNGYRIEIYADGNETNPRILTTSQNTSYLDGSGWHEIILDNPVLINDTHNIWIVLTSDLIYNEPYQIWMTSVIIGTDEGSTATGKSDLIYYSDSWWTLTDFGYDVDLMVKARIGGNVTHITTISDVVNNSDVETSNLLLESNTSYDWYAVADDSLSKTKSDTFTFTTAENTMPVIEHAIPRLESDGYLYMLYRNGNINLSNLNLLMGSYSPFTVCKFNYTSSDWDSEFLTINTNDYIKVKINESDLPYTDTLISIIPQIRFKISDVEDNQLDVIVKSNSSGTWEIIEQWEDVSQGWFSCEDSNMNEYNTTYYYKINVTDSFGNNLISDFSFITTSTEPAIPPIQPSIDLILMSSIIIGIILAFGVAIYILNMKGIINLKKFSFSIKKR